MKGMLFRLHGIELTARIISGWSLPTRPSARLRIDPCPRLLPGSLFWERSDLPRLRAPSQTIPRKTESGSAGLLIVQIRQTFTEFPQLLTLALRWAKHS